MELAKTHADRLKELKKKVEESYEYFRDNVNRFEKFMRFVFKSSLTENEASTLADLGKPTIEFNILEAFVSRLRGEFAKQEPNLTVRAADGVPLTMLTPEFTETINVVEAHLRAIFFDAANDMLDYNSYSDLLGGGYSVSRVSTEYVNEKSFEQNIVVERVFDPTLTFFDPLARKSHKGDGKYCGELYPMTYDRFIEEFGEDTAKEMTFTRNLASFDWSYQNDREKIVLVADYYEKKTRKETILKLTNGHSITKKEYQKFIQRWEEEGNIEQPPLPLQERKTLLEYICRYRICESKVLDYVETDYKYLPLVFIDGNSIILKESGAYKQMTRPFVYHAEGIQRLKNFAGQTLASEIENTISHKFVVAIESVPDDYKEAYQNIQKPDTLMYNHFYDPQNPEVTLPPPREVMRTPIPPEISNTFSAADQMMQNILGSYDNSQGVNQAQMSGIAFARSAIQSNNSSMPYIVGFIKGLNRIAQIIVDLIPKYYRTPRSLPILLPNGKRAYKEINKKGSLYMNFDPNHLNVRVEAGVNFAMQKELALQTMLAMTQANEGFAKFFNQEGLPTLLDNIDIRGIDQIKMKAEVWMQKQKQMEAQQMQMAQQQQQQQMQQAQVQQMEQQMQMAAMQKELQSPSQTQVEQMYIQQKAQTDAATLAIKARDSETKFLDTLSKIQSEDVKLELEAAKLLGEKEMHAIDSVMKISENIASSIPS